MSLLLYIFLIIFSSIFSNISKEYINLINWIENNKGYISKKVKPIEISKYNRIMKSTEKIKKEELIAFIPEKIIISSINYLVNPICRNAYGLEHEQDLECIALFFTLDKNNPKSFFKPYYDYLPDLDIKIFPPEFPIEEQILYEEIDLDLFIGIHNHKIRSAYNDAVERILSEKNIKNSFEKFKYNFYIGQTRNFSRPNSKFSNLNSMVPFIDLFNHDNNFNLDWEYSDQKKGFILKSVKDIEKDEELITTYGEINNMNLFNDYGFTIKNNKYKTPIRIKLDVFKYTFYPSEEEKEIKKDILRISKVLKEKYGFEKEKEKFIYELMLNGLKEKLEKLNLIKIDNNLNIRNIVEEEIINISKNINIIENYYLINRF